MRRSFPIVLAFLFSIGAYSADNRGYDRLVKEVRHELVMLPYYNVFDNLAFKVDGSTVTLMGQVTRPTLKSDAERVVKSIEGVDKVVNKIEVLPLSPNDERIRMAVYRAIYGNTSLQRYGLQAVPPIHIIVNNGNVTLEGVVATEADKNIANLQANGVQGVTQLTHGDFRFDPDPVDFLWQIRVFPEHTIAHDILQRLRIDACA